MHEATPEKARGRNEAGRITVSLHRLYIDRTGFSFSPAKFTCVSADSWHENLWRFTCRFRSMPGKIIFLGRPEAVDLSTLNRVSQEFGWGVHTADDVRDVVNLPPDITIVAVLVRCRICGMENSWPDAIKTVRTQLPHVNLVLCHGFSEPINWPELSDLGAFHALRLPLIETEVRQSFGFLWQAEKRLGCASERGTSAREGVHPTTSNSVKVSVAG